jgi:diguanylate cyclase (GGDEF)-like protein
LARAQEELSLKETVEKRVGELSLLYDVAKSLTSTLDLSELFTRITSLVAERLLIPQFSIMLVSSSGKLEVKSAYPPGAGTEERSFDIGQGACGLAGKTMKPVYIANLETDRSIFLTRDKSAKEKGSLLCVPMIHKGRLLGVLNFQRPAINAFPLEEIELLTAVSDLAGLAVTNVHLHGETVALSITDPLTGLPNRRHLMTRLEMEIARANRFATQISILMVDIDHFKQLNDIRGHRAGDEILIEVSTLLRASLRKVDLVSRYGGEEFVLVLPQVTKVEAVEVAEKLRIAVESIGSEYASTQPLGLITISVGIANLPSDATTVEHLVDSADSALYAAKRAGRNKAIAYATGMELHPGRERGPYAAARKAGDTSPVVVKSN